MTNREAFTRALMLAQHDEHLARAIRPYVDRYGAKGMRRILDAATVATLLEELTC